jgi:hypothetical protein
MRISAIRRHCRRHGVPDYRADRSLATFGPAKFIRWEYSVTSAHATPSNEP